MKRRRKAEMITTAIIPCSRQHSLIKDFVEVTRVELVSKHILQKLSTCLFCFEVSGNNWEQTTDHFLS